jgi:hypothetical protein
MASIRAAQVRGSLGGMEPAQRPVPEANSQSFLMGAMVVAASGKIQECGADPALILGLAARKGQNIVGPEDNAVFLFTPDTLVEMNVKGTAGLNAIQATDRFTSWGTVKDASGHWVIDKDETTADTFVIVDFIDPVGEVNGRVLAVPRITRCQLHSQA